MISNRELILWFVLACLTAQAIGGFVIYFLVSRRIRAQAPVDNITLAALLARITETHDGVSKASEALMQVGKQLEQIYQICPLGRNDERKPPNC
jgi:hypothetical protein